MIAIFVSFQAIEIVYTDRVEPNQHIFLEQKTPGVFTVIKQGIKLQQFFRNMTLLKDCSMSEQKDINELNSPLFVCFSSKSKKYTEPIFQAICPQFAKHIMYFRIDKKQFSQVSFNRAILQQNQICYGEGFSQLRAKQQMRIAFTNIIKDESKKYYIFIQKNPNELKDLKKDGFQHLLSDFDWPKFQIIYKQLLQQKTVSSIGEVPEIIAQKIKSFNFASKYLQKLYQTQKDITVKQILPFNNKSLTIQSFLQQLYTSSVYYNITTKSWIPHELSKQISAYVFHNLSDQKLYISKASKLKDLSNQQDYDKKILANHLNFIIDPDALIVPHDKNVTLMKFSKIKIYQNKKAFLNVRPYIENLQTLEEMNLSSSDLLNIFKNGELCGRKIKRIGGILLMSLIMNDSLKVKCLCSQLTLVQLSKMDGEIMFVNRNTLSTSSQDLFLCRTDYFNVLNTDNYKIISKSFRIKNSQQIIEISIQDLHSSIIQQICRLIQNLTEQRMTLIKSILIYYRWSNKMTHFYELIQYRINAIKEIINAQAYTMDIQDSLLVKYPHFCCLLLEENYNYFMVPSRKIYSPIDYSLNNFKQPFQADKQQQNPYNSYLNKTCSFAIYHLAFPVLTFLQWIKSTGKYQIIEYISMINHNYEDYVVMDKRLKLTATNQKKNAILVVDHLQVCQQIVNKPKGIKTVMIFRMKKSSEIQNIGIITGQVTKNESLQDSQDQIIAILWRRGRKIFGQTRKFQLYDWILTSYIKIKCNLYHLNFNTAQQFLQILHKLICTNRHRVKQIHQTYPQYFHYLYVFPIIKQNQKIIFNYHFFQYLHVKFLFLNILKGKWTNRLQTYQNSSVIFCKKLFSEEMSSQIVKILIKCLRQLEQQNISISDYKNQRNDILQLIRSLTITANLQQQCQKPYCLFFQVCPKLIKIQNYFSINTVINGNTFLIIDNEQNIQILMHSDSAKSIKLQKSKQQQIISIYCTNNQLFILTYNQKEENVFISQLLIDLETELRYTIVRRNIIQNLIFQEYLKKIDDKKLIKMCITENQICLASAFQNKLTVILFDGRSASQTLLKVQQFLQPINNMQIMKDNATILCCNKSQFYKCSINSSTFKDKPLKIGNFTCSSIETQNITVTQNIQNCTILSTYLNQFQIIILNHNFNILKRGVMKMKEHIRCMNILQDLIFLFYEGDDKLQLYRLSNSQQINMTKIWTYYWVENNCTRIHMHGELLYLQGSSNYIKKIELRNTETLKDQIKMII